MAEELKGEQPQTEFPKSVIGKAANQIRVRNPSRFQTVYANNVAIGFSAFDMSITLGEIVGEEDGKPVVEETVKVLLTREMGKVFSRLLSNNIEAFEKNFGKIIVPDVTRILEEAPSEEEAEDQTKAKGKTRKRASK